MSILIADYLDHLTELQTTALLIRKQQDGEMSLNGLPSKIFICIGPHRRQPPLPAGTASPTAVHVIASSADHFQDLSSLHKWAREAHDSRKQSFPAQNVVALRLTDQFYNKLRARAGDSEDPLTAWYVAGEWTSRGIVVPAPTPTSGSSGSDGTAVPAGPPLPTLPLQSQNRDAPAPATAATGTSFDHWGETAVALDVKSGLRVCPRCTKCRGTFLFAQSADSLVVESFKVQQQQ
ncbi:hypothetical protein UCRPA7_3180 [Phaeoacremonium minimum UCRPA7]|uniref:Uncharacterized protein n=1 Tax=Phaeoacremonium minimum (strain UCR-PA7) TaxID=1286976 RepID=R8BPQ0_PHAM7|nr:hypothetical protein UCRPA7_3180 [Phaeoacremonium minimum UCRPA7]EOO01322.1 hypothetical protein UCRPA7_3180 [Phaeoacremonium minimum UCRPA7]